MGIACIIHLFGTPAAFDETGTALETLRPGKPFALLSYLLVNGNCSREKLIALLWGDMPESKARNAFRQALHRLRAALGENVIPHDPEVLSISESAGITTDVTAFERFLDQGDLDSAIASYSGEFLAGMKIEASAFDEWAESTRKRYRARYRDALRSAVQRDLESGESGRALQRASLLVATDSSDVDGAILHATTLVSAGRRAEAVHALEQFERTHKEVLGSPAPTAIREFVARLRRAPIEPDARRPGRTRAPLTGRETELAFSLAHLRSLEAGAGSLLIVEGEPGVGKTRLLEEFFARARDITPSLFLLGRERSGSAAIPYASVAEALRGALDAPGLSGTGQHLLAEASRLLPQLRDSFSLPPISDIVDDAGRVRFYEGIAALLESVAYEQPICIALDDFHNASPVTVGLVQYLIDRLRAAPILFVLLGRRNNAFTTAKHRLLDQAHREPVDGQNPRSAMIELEPLFEADSRTLARELTGGRISEEVIDRIAAEAAGFPYRIAVLSEKALAGDVSGTLPASLRDILWARLQKCTQPEQRLFVAAALLDRPVSIRLLAAASHLPEKAALDAALCLEREGLVVQRADGVVPTHECAGELALEGTGPAGRALLAGWAADALEKDRSATPAELASLFRLAGRRPETYRYSMDAGFAAMRAAAPMEGKRHFETALAAAPGERERKEVEAILNGLGGGLARLPGSRKEPHTNQPVGETPKIEDPVVVSTEAAAGSPGDVDSRSQKSSTSRRKLPRRGATLIVASVAVIVLALVRAAGNLNGSSAPGISLADTLLVVDDADPRNPVIAFTTGQLGSPLSTITGATRYGPARSWIDSLRLPWTNPLPSPDRRMVAVERITKNGSALYVISSDRRDTIPLRVGEGDNLFADWSPDGRWLLGTTGDRRSSGEYSVSLYAYSLTEGGRRIGIDTSSAHDVVDATWSPDGSHIAWTARLGSQHQQDIFLSNADGSNTVNLTRDPGEDYSLAWSPDGRRLAFTSERSGRAELYSIDIATRELRRLTWDGAHADNAIFSPDGRWLAYETTREGKPAVYVMPAWGGNGRGVAPAQARVSLLGWRGRSLPYIDRLSIDVPHLKAPGDTGSIVVRALDRAGHPLSPGDIGFSVLDPGTVRIIGEVQTSEPDHGAKLVTIQAVSRGLGRIAVSAGNWRTDTTFVSTGNETLTLLSDNFDTGLNRSRWHVLGLPHAQVSAGVGRGGSVGLVPRSDREWQSGVLSASIFPIREGLTVRAWVSAPLRAPVSAAKSFAIAIVAADPAEVLDSVAPKFLRLATFSWLAPSGRFSYAVGREIFTEPVTNAGAGDAHEIEIRVAPDGRVVFLVDGVERWRSTLTLEMSGENSRAQLWLGTRAAGADVVFDDAAVYLKIPGDAGPRRAK